MPGYKLSEKELLATVTNMARLMSKLGTQQKSLRMKTTLISALIFICASLALKSQMTEYGKFTKADCPIEIPEELASSGKFIFGYMTVPEFHGQPGSQAIELAIAIFKCRKDSAIYDPLILNSGGPGMSNLEDFVPTFAGPLGNLFLFERDVVIIELRGLKHSRPSLLSPELDQVQMELLDEHLSYAEMMKKYRKGVHSVQEKFAEQGINLSAYNYTETASDIAFVMEALGYHTFAAFGNSAGTIVAQYLLMDHADKLSALSLNAVAHLPYGFSNMCVTSINKLESLFRVVENNKSYELAYSGLKQSFLSALIDLEASPEILEVILQGSETPTTIVLDGKRTAQWIFGQMYWNTQLPLTMHKITQGDYSEIVNNPAIFLPTPHFSNGSFWSMVMSSWPDPTDEQLFVGTEWELFVQGIGMMPFSQPFVKQVRDAWKVEHKPGNIKAMTKNVPTLMLNGAEDHVCLAGHVRELSDSFELSHCYIFDGIAHSPIDAGECAIMMMKQFLDNPLSTPDDSCMEAFVKSTEYKLPED